MKRSLIYFAVLYGEATTAVFLIAWIAYWVDTPTGIAHCSKWNLSPVACGTALSCTVLFLTGIATISMFKKLKEQNKDTKSDS